MRTVTTVLDPVPSGHDASTMKALVYNGPGRRAWQSSPRPIIREPGDAIVRITTATICGTDLHILKVMSRR